MTTQSQILMLMIQLRAGKLDLSTVPARHLREMIGSAPYFPHLPIDVPRVQRELDSRGPTPAPWLSRGKSDSVHEACPTHPYGYQLFAFIEDQGPSDADLALILAAPLLLAALKKVVADVPGDALDAWHCQALEALAAVDRRP